MNERISKLIRQADVHILPDESEYGHTIVGLEKFAELIVQDCVSEVALMGVTNFENEDISWACGVIIDGIKNKFGDINDSSTTD
jgi:hypothetical protein